MCSGTGRTELGMEIHRNSLGHRCYTAQDIQIFLGIRELKKKGLHLKAIRELMPKLVQATAEIKAFPAEAAETAKEKPDPAIPGKADEVPEVVVDLLPEREAEQLADHCDAAGRGGASDGVLPRARPSARSDDTEAAPGRAGAAVWTRRSAATSRAGEKQRRRWSRKENGRKQNGAIEPKGKLDRKKKNACERRSFGTKRKSGLFLQPDNR